MPAHARAPRPSVLALALLLALALGCAACAGQLAPAPAAPAAPSAQAELELLAGKDDPQSRLAAMRALRSLGRNEEAIAEANRLILRQPRSSQAFVERALAFSALGYAERALEDIEAALIIAPGNAAVLMVQGDLYFLLEMPDLAEQSYAKAIAAAPADPLGWVNRGVARDEQGRHAEAIADFTRALELDPRQASALANRGVSRSQAGDMPGMCEDYAAACALGQCRRLEDARLMGYCR